MPTSSELTGPAGRFLIKSRRRTNKMRKRYKHRCRWLYQPRKKAGEYSKESWPKKVLYCWQTGKNVRERECTPCLLARLITVKSSMVNSLLYKRPLTSAEWGERHGG